MLQTQLLRLSPKRPTSPTTPFTTNSTSNRPANAFVSLSCNYNAHPRLQPEAGSLHLPFEVETNLQLIEIKDHENKPRGWTSVFEGEQFIQTIAGGGSGASIALMRNTQDQLIIRKLQHGKAQKEAARAQNLESIGQAMLIGKEPTTSLPPKVQAIIRDKKKQLDQFVKQTRSEVTKRFVILNERQDQPNTYFACGYDQTAFANTNPNSQQLTAPEFAKAIQNKNNPLSPPRLQTLVQAQLNLTHLFQTAQSEIYLEPLSQEDGKHIFYETYIAKFEERLGTGFDVSKLSDQCNQSMKLEACGNSLNNNIQVNNLLLTPKITINNQECINPLAYAQNMKDSFISQKEGFLLHGDLQQTNAILIEDDTGSSLRCIDNRGATIQDYLADLTKMLWGPTFVPIMEDMLQINCDISPENLILETKAKPGMSYAVDNLHLFGQHFSEAVHTSKACIDYLKDNPQANSQLLFTAGLQYLRDLGFVLPRLKAAMALDNPETALALSRRIMGDFAAAAIHMTEHKALYGNNDAEQKVDQQLNKKTP